jgi:hypothetical protein
VAFGGSFKPPSSQNQAPESAAVNPRAFSTVLHGEAAIALAEDRPRVLNGMKK